MNRQEVYNKCVEKIYPSLKDYEEGVCFARRILPEEAIDAIIDCAVEEAVKAMEDKTE